MPKLAVIGNCQAPGLAACLEALVPDASVAFIHLGKITPEDEADFARSLGTFDVVFTQGHSGPGRALDDAAVREAASKVIHFPHIAFSGFHPDFFTLFQADGKPLRGPTWSYQSAIVAASFVIGKRPRHVPSLFNTYIFQLLGYFDVFDRHRHDLIHRAAQMGVDLTGPFAAWQRRGCFMHSTNHPDVMVLADLARDAAARAGLAFRDADLPADRLLTGAVLPVYPDLAKRLGIKARDAFKPDDRQIAAGHMPLSLQLDEFVVASYKRLSRASPEWKENARVKATAEVLLAA